MNRRVEGGDRLWDGMQPNYFTINGRSHPATEGIPMRVGETLKAGRLRGEAKKPLCQIHRNALPIPMR
jgi:hypothetical protein